MKTAETRKTQEVARENTTAPVPRAPLENTSQSVALRKQLCEMLLRALQRFVLVDLRIPALPIHPTRCWF